MAAGFREVLDEAYAETRWSRRKRSSCVPRGAAVVAKVPNLGERRGEVLDSEQLLVFPVAGGLVSDVRISIEDPAAVADFWPD